jgi:TetR/AcrR family transcriptional regulator, cholesterol catabolism regulator
VARPASARRREFAGGYAPEETRKALLDSALELFSTHGYADTSVQQIADRAHLTKGAFYHHFESKEDLLRLIHDEFLDHQLALLREALAHDGDPAERLRHLLRALLGSLETYLTNVKVFFQERRHLTGARFEAIKVKRDEFDRLFQQAIDDGVRTGAFRNDLQARIVGLGILGMCSWVSTWYRPTGPLDAEQIADTFSDMVLDGLLSPPTAVSPPATSP